MSQTRGIPCNVYALVVLLWARELLVLPSSFDPSLNRSCMSPTFLGGFIILVGKATLRFKQRKLKRVEAMKHCLFLFFLAWFQVKILLMWIVDPIIPLPCQPLPLLIWLQCCPLHKFQVTIVLFDNVCILRMSCQMCLHFEDICMSTETRFKYCQLRGKNKSLFIIKHSCLEHG